MAKPKTAKVAEGTLQKCRDTPLEPMPTEPVGEPIMALSNRERLLFDEIIRSANRSTLYRPDNIWVCGAAKIAAVIEEGNASTDAHAKLMSYLSKLGMSPANRKDVIAHLTPEERNEFAAFD